MCLSYIILWLVAAWPTWTVSKDVDRELADYALGRGVSGGRCLTSCAAGDGRCIVDVGDSSQRLELCWYLQYYTAQLRDKDVHLCLGPCILDKYSFYKCAINDTAWDYCNPETRHELVYEARTLVGERCAGACSADAVGAHECRKQSGSPAAACDPRALHYFRAHTWLGAPCSDRCELRAGLWGLQCHTADGHQTICVPPARWYMRASATPPPSV